MIQSLEYFDGWKRLEKDISWSFGVSDIHCPPTCLILGRQQQHILPATIPKPQQIPTLQLNILPPRQQVTINPSPIRAVQINHIRPHAPHAVPERVLRLHVPELDHGVLLAAAGVLDGDVDHQPLPPEQPAAARLQPQRFQQRRAFVDVEPPRGRRRREPRRGGFVVFQHDGGVGYGVGFGREFAARFVVGFLLLLGGWRLGGGLVELVVLGGERGFGAVVGGRFWDGGWG